MGGWRGIGRIRAMARGPWSLHAVIVDASGNSTDEQINNAYGIS